MKEISEFILREIGISDSGIAELNRLRVDEVRDLTRVRLDSIERMKIK